MDGPGFGDQIIITIGNFDSANAKIVIVAADYNEARNLSRELMCG
jgi:hypothetical protein